MAPTFPKALSLVGGGGEGVSFRLLSQICDVPKVVIVNKNI
jgi:hypothetical protein